jgi:hypothetical protein
VVGAATAAAFWWFIGRSLCSEYQAWQAQVQAAADSEPVGYVGLAYRRTYNDRPIVFHAEKDGRKLLFAAKGAAAGTTRDYYDVTESDIDVKRLDGGFGRDSIPGVDYPILDPPGGSPGRSLRDSQPVFGLNLRGGPRAYPQDLLAKIEVVNDADGTTPFVAVFDRSRGQALLCERTVRGGAVTFGTTGYSYDRRPLLYDRKTRSLWLPQGDELVCVNGELKGSKLAPLLKPEPATWADWKRRHPDTGVLVGNDRDKPIPAE